MKKKISLIIICLTMSGSITGNSTVFAQEDYQTIMEDYKAVILLLDQINYQYDCALEAIGDCIDGKINLSEAEEKVNGTISALMEEKESYNFYYKCDEEKAELLEKYQINVSEFETFGNSVKNEYISSISNLTELSDDLYYAERSDSEYKKLISDQEDYKELQGYRKGYHYYQSFNYWVSGWNKEMVSYVQTQIIPESNHCFFENFKWENDRDAAKRKAVSYINKYEEGIQQLSENREETEKKKDQNDPKSQENIFEAYEFMFEVPDSWKQKYSGWCKGENGTSYYGFYDEEVSYKSDHVLMYLILTYDEAFKREDGFEYTKLDGKTVFGRSIYMAVNIKEPEMISEDKKFEQQYLEMRSDCEEIPGALKLKTDYPVRKIENDKYSFYLPESWDGNVIITSRKGKTYTSYSFYQKKSFVLDGGGQLQKIALCDWGSKPDLLDGAQLLAQDEDAQLMFWIGGPTCVTYEANDEEITEEYYKLKDDCQVIVATFKLKK